MPAARSFQYWRSGAARWSALTGTNNPEAGSTRAARIAECPTLAALAGANRPVFTRAGLRTAWPVRLRPAGAWAHDPETLRARRTCIAEGALLSAASCADGVVFHRTHLWPIRPRRTRAIGAFLDYDGTTRQNNRGARECAHPGHDLCNEHGLPSLDVRCGNSAQSPKAD